MHRVRLLPAVMLFLTVLLFQVFPGYQKALAKEKVSITADEHLSYDLEKNAFTVQGNVRIVQGETVILADRAEIDAEGKVARMTGNVRLTQPDVALTSSSLVAYLNERRVVAEGEVVLLKDEKQAPKGDKGKASTAKDRVNLRCERLDYWTSKKEAVAQGNIFVTKGEIKAWSSKASYREKDKIMILTGDVRVERPKGEKLFCEELVFHTDRDAVEARSRVYVEFEIEDKDQEKG